MKQIDTAKGPAHFMMQLPILIAIGLAFDALAFSDSIIQQSARRSVDSQRCSNIITSNYMSSPSRKITTHLSRSINSKASMSTRLHYSDETSHRLDIAKAWSNVIDEYIKLQEGRAEKNPVELIVDKVVDQVSEDLILTEEVIEDYQVNNDDDLLENNYVNADENTISVRAAVSVKEDASAWPIEDINEAIEADASVDNNEFIADDNTLSDREDTLAWPTGESFSYNVEDNTNSSDERRQQRIQALNSFNRAAKSRQLQQTTHKQLFQMQDAVQQEQQARNKPTPLKLDLPYNDPSQLHAIQSNAPAILLSSGPGTGKSHVLSLRIAYLLRMQLDYQTDKKTSIDNNHHLPSSTLSSTPDSMVILSFTNRDASRLKEAALNILFPNNVHDPCTEEWREQTSKQLWSGTMHVFALAILRKYGYSAATPLRVLPARAMRNRVSQCLRVLLNGGEDGQKVNEDADLNELRVRHLQALDDVGQSRFILFQNIVRCIDLWKEALLIPSTCCGDDLEESADGKHQVMIDEQEETQLRNDCVKLAMRLGIPKSSALLALDVFPSYQAKHAVAGTADPSDLAGMAYRLLLTNTEALYLLRAKLKHIIVDEYQDVSVSQHALLRLVVRGKTDDDCCSSKLSTGQSQRKRYPILMDTQTSSRRVTLKKRPRANTSLNQNYNVPNLFVAGDTKQSIYGWRAAAPSLTVDGFRRDYPQGVVASLGEYCS